MSQDETYLCWISISHYLNDSVAQWFRALVSGLYIVWSEVHFKPYQGPHANLPQSLIPPNSPPIQLIHTSEAQPQLMIKSSTAISTALNS